MEQREIKFRAWDERNKIMHYDFQYIKSGEESIDWIVFTSDKQILKDKPHPFENSYFSIQFKITEYTGLKDKNGVNGYHKDIVRSGKKIYVIEWQKEEARFFLAPYKGTNNWEFMDMLESFEIIGNVFENPELLK